MNFYKHHLGDYDGHTAHLSWDEDMAYTRLLRAYYRREQPIPAAEAYRLARASGKVQRSAVDSVLREFFTEGQDGWRNKRADEEIAEYHEGEEGRGAKAENEKERQRRHRARRKELFDALRSHGIVPAWDAPTETLETMLKSRDRKSPVTRDNHPPATRDATANQNPEPRTKNQEPEESTSKPLASGDESPSAGGTAKNALNDAAVAHIPLVDGSEFGVTAEALSEFEKAYPAVDCKQTLQEIRVWCVANPANRKTRKGALRFVNSWLSREQNKAR